MSIIKSIKQQLGIGGTASEQHFWDGSVANQLTLKRGTPDAPGATVAQVVNGVFSPVKNYLFKAKKTGALQSVVSGSWNTIQFNAEDTDPDSAYDTTTYRYNPKAHGWYQVQLQVWCQTNSTSTDAGIRILKNGDTANGIVGISSSVSNGDFATSAGILNCSTLVYMNGTSDYLEAQVSITATNPYVSGDNPYNWFSGYFVRSA